MTAEIIDLDGQRPHIGGEAICQHCKHEWLAVAPVGVHPDTMECPKCGTCQSTFKYPVAPTGDYWECKCGCELFYVLADGNIQCRKCGVFKSE